MRKRIAVFAVAAGLALGGGAQAQSQVPRPSSGAAPWFVAQADTCREATSPSDRVQALRRAGERTARALPYRPAGAAPDAEPTRFTVRRADGAEEVHYRTREDCLASLGGSARRDAAAPRSAGQEALTDRNGNPCPVTSDDYSRTSDAARADCARARNEREWRRTAEIARRMEEDRAASAAAPPAAPVASGWFLLAYEDGCQPFNGSPLEMLELGRAAGQPIEYRETRAPDGSAVVQLFRRGSEPSLALTYFRTMAGCQSFQREVARARDRLR